MNERNTRVSYIDIFRGIGIIFMIMGHIGFGTAFGKFIHGFNMPMFFFVSGYFYKKSICSYDEFLLKITKKLLVPYFTFGLFHYLVWCIYYKKIGVKPIISLLFFNTDSNMPIVGAIWFLTALFFVELIYFIFNKYIDNIYLLNTIILIISLLGCILNNIYLLRLPWALDASFVGLGFYHLGRLFKSYGIEKRISNSKILLKGIIMLIIGGELIFFNGNVNMRLGTYSCILIFWVGSMFAIISFWLISIFISYIKNIIVFKLNKIIQMIGRESIIYLGMNQIIIIVFKNIFNYEFKSIIQILIFRIIILVLVLIFLNLISKCILNSKLKVLIGK